jgi:hypothetical protein
MALDTTALASAVFNAVKPVLADEWKDVESYAKVEAAKLAATLAHIEQLSAEEKISEDEASALLDMQKNATQAVLLTIEGIGLITAQQAINAAIGAIRGIVNKALGFGLL